MEDLDSLVLRCRNSRAREYVREAITCYKNGAFRAAIVSTWTAVVYDVIDKLRELSIAGDKAAEQFIDQLDSWISRNDVNALLRMEREIVDTVAAKFELFSDTEIVDLKRIHDDRNRCAHPSLNADSEPFSPPAELARLHIVNAILCALQHLPVQGKSALDQALREIESQYFPFRPEQALDALSHGPLAKPRASLLRNAIVVLLKRLLDPTSSDQIRYNYVVALKAIQTMHHAEYGEVLSQKLSDIVRAIPDDSLHLIQHLLWADEGVLSILDDPASQRIRSYVRQLPSSHVADLETYAKCAELSREVEQRVAMITLEEFLSSLFFTLPQIVAEHLVDIYVASDSFDQANQRSVAVTRYAGDLSQSQVIRLLASAVQNGQITGSYQFSSVVRSIVRANQERPEWINGVLQQYDLDAFVKA